MADEKKARVQRSDQVEFLQYVIKYFKYAGLLCLVWVTGYTKFSVSWVLIALFAYMLNEEYRKIKTSKIAFAKEAVLNEKDAILARVDELPSWVSVVKSPAKCLYLTYFALLHTIGTPTPRVQTYDT